MDGHFAGAKKTIDLFKHIFSTTEVQVVTGWFLSTENLNQRSAAELEFIFSIYKTIGNDLDDFLVENHINFKRIGNPEGIPEDFREFLFNKERNFHFPDSQRFAVFAINYG
jgi:undecaprenyl diphosphate synthase